MSALNFKIVGSRILKNMINLLQAKSGINTSNLHLCLLSSVFTALVRSQHTKLDYQKPNFYFTLLAKIGHRASVLLVLLCLSKFKLD